MIDIPDAPWVGLCEEDYLDSMCPYHEEDDWEDEDDEELYG